MVWIILIYVNHCNKAMRLDSRPGLDLHIIKMEVDEEDREEVVVLGHVAKS